MMSSYNCRDVVCKVSNARRQADSRNAPSIAAASGSVAGSGAFDVHGLRPGLALLYQIHDLAGRATGYWIGAKFYSPTNGFKNERVGVRRLHRKPDDHRGPQPERFLSSHSLPH